MDKHSRAREEGLGMFFSGKVFVTVIFDCLFPRLTVNVSHVFRAIDTIPAKNGGKKGKEKRASAPPHKKGKALDSSAASLTQSLSHNCVTREVAVPNTLQRIDIASNMVNFSLLPTLLALYHSCFRIMNGIVCYSNL